MRFLTPWWLLLLLPVLALVIAYVVNHRRRSAYAVRFATLPMLARLAPRRPGWRRHLPAALLLTALVAMGLATARPEVDLRVPHERATVIVAIDVSRSMQATDISPNRLDAAAAAASAFIENLPDTFNVGVVTFSGTASVLASPTTDHAAVVRRLQNLWLADSTAIGEAVVTSLDQVAAMAREADPNTDPNTGPTSDPNPDPDGAGRGDPDGANPGRGDPLDPDSGQLEVPARIVLLSDGTNTRGRDPAEAAAAASAAGVPVSTIAYGTPDGMIQIRGRTINVPVDEVTLRSLAEETGGLAYTAESGDELAAVYEDIGSSIGWRTEPREVTAYLSAFALLVAVAAGFLSLRWFARIP